MKLNRAIAVCLIVICIVSGALAATAIQERKTKKVTRVKRPTFTERDWDGIYFENLFEDGLVGDRPQQLNPGSLPNAQSNEQLIAGDGDSTEAAQEFAWSKVISRATVEDEVKRLQKQLALDVTTPVKFKSEYAKAHQSYSMLSMLFAIIGEYDQEIRWKNFAAEAQVSFEKAAANARVGTSQSYESCRRRLEDLTEMVRGGNFAGSESPPANLDWSIVVDRSPLMERLQSAQDRLKLLTASKGEFTRELASVIQEAELVAAISNVLTRENMTDADDEGYVEFANAMNMAALQIVTAGKNNDFDAASRAANITSQSCDNCHSEWR
jgi:cytochrome c556